jgi:hypothetical protein
MVECLPSKCKVLNSSPSTTQKKKWLPEIVLFIFKICKYLGIKLEYSLIVFNIGRLCNDIPLLISNILASFFFGGGDHLARSLSVRLFNCLPWYFCCCSCCNAGYHTQSFIQARQVLYHWATPQPYLLVFDCMFAFHSSINFFSYHHFLHSYFYTLNCFKLSNGFLEWVLRSYIFILFVDICL